MLAQLALFLAAAVLFVPLFRWLKLGAVLGYLAAGIAIGPWGLGLIDDVEAILHISELGVVLLLFVIGLELQPSRLWRLRHSVFGLGGAQVLISALLLGAAAMALGLSFTAAVVAGFGLAMSSTALVLQMLGERKELTTRHGRGAFAILLFQDLSVIPLLAVVPLLGLQAAQTSGDPGWWAALRTVAVLVGVVVIGRYALRPLLRMLAATQVAEVFTAAALLLVLGTALAMQWVGLSMSLGAFLAGVLLADSEYRHELQADIEPFKGLLLGLFFIAVGMSANLGLLAEQPLVVGGLVLGLLLVKGAVLYAIGRVAGQPVDSARALAFALPQGGEFAFVLFALAAGVGVLASGVSELLVMAVTLSMILSPPLYSLQARFAREEEAPAFDVIDVPETPVVIAGFGPFGQVIGRLLRVKRIGFTVLEKNWQQVDFVR
ncbi:MAG TPA: monovalent cation:proton antiporter-2 (CPA2) family protein, partial [Nevskiaceae bacterium]|nr:monovalent cation:proton antiporter-2 (CPA2) family protein [Nevskiaceae bacterium]